MILRTKTRPCAQKLHVLRTFCGNKLSIYSCFHEDVMRFFTRALENNYARLNGFLREDETMKTTDKKPNLTIAVVAPKAAGTFVRPGMHYRPE
jgi:hypothetical protein